jgi:hypothetical protein
MAFVSPEKRVIEAEGYVKASIYSDVEEVYREIAQAVERDSVYDVEEEYPLYIYEQKVYKITIKVERV